MVCGLGVLGCSSQKNAGESNGRNVEDDGAYHVYPGSSIQEALDVAARDSKHKVVKVHAGEYAPTSNGQALIWFNKAHDGIRLEAVGKVILTAANPEKCLVTSPAYPAIVNHVVYFGHGVSNKTVIDGFEITGANQCMIRDGVEKIEPDLPEDLSPGLFFFSDGGAVKIYGNSCPQLLNLNIHDNEAAVCGGGISIEHRSKCATPVKIENCIFRNNGCPGTGSAIDILEGGKADITNCLFVGNIGNILMDKIELTYGLRYNPKHGCGALTVFPKSTAIVDRCTFTENWSGVDDKGVGSKYTNSIFWKNEKSDGSREGGPYELDVTQSATVTGCYIHGNIPDLRKTISQNENHFENTNPDFDEAFNPRSKTHQGVGYRQKD